MLAMNVGQKSAQKQENDHHHQGDAQTQRELDIGDGSSDGRGAIADGLNFYRGRDPPFNGWEHGTNPVHSFNDISVRLFEDD